MTTERVKELESQREKALLLDQSKEDAGSLVDGTRTIETHFNKPEMIALSARSRAAPSLSQRRR